MPNPWFTNRGQVLQTLCVIVGTGLAIRNAFKDLQDNQFFTAGAVLAYVLVALVLISAWILIREHRPKSVPSDASSRESELHSEIARLNQHIKDIQGQQIHELKRQSQTTDAIAPNGSHRIIPDLRISYVKRGGSRPALTFKTSHLEPLHIRQIGPLVSIETYACEHKLNLLQGIHPEIAKDSPVECQINGLYDKKANVVPLDSVLEAGGAATSDSVTVEYTAKDSEEIFSRRFFLHKNADGSIVWSSQDWNPEANDLSRLRRVLSFTRSAVEDLIHAGRLRQLVKECSSLQSWLFRILSEYEAAEGQPLSCPMKRDLITLDPGEAGMPSWERLRLMSFRDAYSGYKALADELLGTSPALPALPDIPNEMPWQLFSDALTRHRDAVFEISNDIEDRYAAVFFGVRPRAATS